MSTVVHAIRRNSKSRSHDENQEIDLVLAVLCVLFRGVPMTYRDIAELTGMSHGGPYVIEQRALKKCRKKFCYTTERAVGRELTT